MRAVAEADQWRWEQQHRLVIVGAFHGEHFARIKRLSGRDLKAELRRLDRKSASHKPQTAAEQIAIMKMVSAGIDAAAEGKG